GDGWRRERHLRGNQVAEGRLWQRSPIAELGLHFSRHTLELLLWFTADNPEDPKSRRRTPPDAELTPADALVCYHAYTALRDTSAGPALPGRLGFGMQELCWLAFPDDFVRRPADQVINFERWTSGVRACILEAMQSELARRWIEAEEHKCRLVEWQSVQQHGQAKELVLTAFLDSAQRAGRQDLARFLLVALGELLPRRPAQADWTGNLRS